MNFFNFFLALGKLLGRLVPLATLAMAGANAASDATPAAGLSAAVEEVMNVASAGTTPRSPGELAADIRPILERIVDFESITRRAIGPGWRVFAEAERQRAIALFSALLVRTYVARIAGGERPHIVFLPAVSLPNDRWEVPTRIGLSGAEHTVVYRLQRQAGEWRIYDIVVEGVSFVANYRAQFDALYQKGGVAAIQRALESRADRVEDSAAAPP